MLIESTPPSLASCREQDSNVLPVYGFPRRAMFFRFPEDAQWNAERDAVEFGVGIGDYEGVVRVSRHVFRRFIDGAVTAERCLEAYHLQRTSLEVIAEPKLRRRQLTEDGNVEITGRDLSEAGTESR